MKMTKYWLICGCSIAESLCASEWNPVSDNKWGNAGNWNGTIPGLPGDDTVAVFPSTTPSVGLDVLLEQGSSHLNVSLSNIQFNNGYVIDAGFGQISAIPSSALTIAVSANALAKIEADMFFDPTQSLDVSASSGSSLTLSGTTTLANSSLTKTGEGTLMISPTGAIVNPGSLPLSQTLNISGGPIMVSQTGFIQCQNTNNNSGASLHLLNAFIENDGNINCINAGQNGDATLDIAMTKFTGNGAMTAQNNIASGNAFVVMNQAMIDGGVFVECLSPSTPGNLSIEITKSTFFFDAGGISSYGAVGETNSQIIINDSEIHLGGLSFFQNTSYISDIEIHNSIIDSAIHIIATSNTPSTENNTSVLSIDYSKCYLQSATIASSVNAQAQNAESTFLLKQSYLQGSSTTLQAESLNSSNGSASLDIQGSTISLQGSSFLSCLQESASGDGRASLTIGTTNVSSQGSIEVSCQNNSTMGGSSLSIENSQLVCDAGNILCKNTGHGDHMNANLNIENSTLTIDSGSISCGGSGVNFLDVTIAISQSTLDLGACGIHCESSANGLSNNGLVTIDKST